MIDWINFSRFVIPEAGVDKVFLSKVQKGFYSSGFTWGIREIALLIGIIVVATLLFYLIKLLFRLDKYSLANLNFDRIENPRRIRRIIRRSIDLRAIYDMEVYDPAYQEIYKCMPIGINRNNELEVEISSYLDPNLDFKDKKVRVAFRMSRRGKQEFYHFETMSLYLDFTVVRDLREKSIRLAIPSVLTRGQKRRFVRIEPVGAFSMNINILSPTQSGDTMPLKAFKVIGEAAVNDISIGGLNVRVTKNKKNQDFKKNDFMYIHFKLPINDLALDSALSDFFIKARVTSFEKISSTDNQLKLIFVERGRLNRETRSISFRPATWMSFEDLSRWMQAYQRHMLQEEKGI
ncbi:MAG: hypothetical protein JRI34_12040, partial [Deltaproteobacteria bacterium]|nr:hypothetical protein [Deltaproteobacteria bacterium]